MTVDTTELRTRARNIDALGLPGTSGALTAAADEIDALRGALDRVPHGTLCGFMMSLYQEPCSCPKAIMSGLPPAPPSPSLDPLVLIPDATTVTYLGVTRLDVHGPAGRVFGVLGLDGVHVEQTDGGRSLVVVFEQNGADRG
ncbi:hypothetical protein [Curtobacterium sp. MCBA15_004]|uniref:hypothetical protein n=1 Tax=Curtobacterium sp. MCBA15_004 TaxID=1898733 RepID=UPI000ADE42CF|nr:hypothetical protein [Curtobacterium sp. MCBA15_004]WIA96436.1 hypothetical protein QOL16_15260 [Curtobacterium sp. MCBA15_004]